MSRRRRRDYARRWPAPGCRCATSACATWGSDTARVEVDGALSARTGRPPRAARRGGSASTSVEVDPRGFRSGSMNELLPDPVRYR